jgi:hypothetical protein
VPGVSFQSPGNTSGLYYTNIPQALFVALNGVQVGAWVNSTFVLRADASQLIMGTLNQGIFGMTGLTAQVASTLGDVVVGPLAALATDATIGFLQIPTCAGTPTGTIAQLKTGKVGIVYDTTNAKICVTAGGGTWVKTAALT